MSLAATCALLGWELRETGEPSYADEPGAIVVWELEDGRLSVVVLGADGLDGDRREYNVSRAAFDLAALLRLRGVQALDVGECEECDGKPTGRRRFPAFEAVLMGEPRQGYNVINGVRRTWNEPGHEGARAALRKLAEGWREHLPVLADWLDLRGYFDTSEREEAIRKWAASRDGPLELADRLGAYGGDGGASSPLGACTCVPRPLAECPALPTWVLAWLAGECPECRGRGGWQEGNRGDDWSDCWACKTTGLALGPHLEAIRAHLTEAWQGDTVECGRCAGSGSEADAVCHEPRTETLIHDPRGPCQGCAGLGRVKPEDT
jgi:hypothetical protein